MLQSEVAAGTATRLLSGASVAARARNMQPGTGYSFFQKKRLKTAGFYAIISTVGDLLCAGKELL